MPPQNPTQSGFPHKLIALLFRFLSSHPRPICLNLFLGMPVRPLRGIDLGCGIGGSSRTQKLGHGDEVITQDRPAVPEAPGQ